ncbi:HNH endonuclease [Gelidibacter japonicus]|uniref:HNH endonuclease n=1 Tax=Gelidibacter japonicus TaxID=1962232 RepID=UPI003A91703D
MIELKSQDNLKKYLEYFANLNRGFNKGLGKAPHKPILLLSILQLIREGSIKNNKVYITLDLVIKFKNNWEALVNTGHSQNFALPFFHMRSEPFWYLVKKTGFEIPVTKSKSIKSFKTLRDSVLYAQIDKELFDLLSDKKNSNIFQQYLLQTYFTDSQSNFKEDYVSYQLKLIEDQILGEDKTNYQIRIEQLKNNLDEDSFQEELFIRGGLFKKTVPKIYNHMCSVSEMKIESTENVQMIDACHIVPFSISNDDTIPNGISLSPNLHRAFDRGLITINRDFKVRVSPTVIENDSVFNLTQFEGKQILLPKNSKWYPSLEALTWHNKEVFLL